MSNAATTLRSDFMARASERDAVAKILRWPSEHYRAKPLEFLREVLGMQLTKEQVEIAEAVAAHARVAIRSGQKTGKTEVLAGLALWHMHTHPDARVVFTAPGNRQVQKAMWRAIRLLHRNAKAKLDGTPGDLAATGVHAPDGRECWGFTADEPGAVNGISGRGSGLFFIADEASTIPDDLLDAVRGNAMGGARMVMMSNPLRARGRFYEAFVDGSRWHQIHISSLDVARANYGIEGLAVLADLENEIATLGAESYYVKTRIKGEFCEYDGRLVFSLDLVDESMRRWATTATPTTGPTYYAADVAGPKGMGDDSAFAVRRSNKVLQLLSARGLTAEQHVDQLLDLINVHGLPVSDDIVIVDPYGPGDAVVTELRRHLASGATPQFRLIAARTSDAARYASKTYVNRRDELPPTLERLIRDEGLTLPPDKRLRGELAAIEWVEQGRRDGKLKVSDKRDMRKALGRSPDRADAVLMTCWEAGDTRRGRRRERPVETHVPKQDIYESARWHEQAQDEADRGIYDY